MNEDLRNVASAWHGGQSSPLYALASTGSIVPGLEAEIRDNLRLLRAGQYSAEEINVETPRLSALLDYVVSQTPEVCGHGDTEETGIPGLVWCRNCGYEV